MIKFSKSPFLFSVRNLLFLFIKNLSIINIVLFGTINVNYMCKLTVCMFIIKAGNNFFN